MAKPKQFTTERKTKYLSLIEKGVPRIRAAEEVGVSYYTIIYHRRNDADFVEKEIEARGAYDATLVALAESGLVLALEGGEAWAIRYVLNNREPDRWSDKPTAITQDDLENAMDRVKRYIDGNQEQING